MDTITCKSFEPLLDNEMVLGIQDSARIFHYKPEGYDFEYYGLCNAIMLCKPGSEFMAKWLHSYHTFDSQGRDMTWDFHSVLIPYMLSQDYDWGDKLTILEPNAFFWPLWDSLDKYLLEPESNKYLDLYKENYAVHLWDNDPHVNTDIIDPEYLQPFDSAYCHYASPCYKDLSKASISLVFLTHNRLEKTRECLTTWMEVIRDREDIGEVLIHDNASDEEFRSWLGQFELDNDRVRVIWSNTNEGVAGGRVVLFDEAVGDIICSVDSDASLSSGTFFDKAKDILSDTKIGVTGVCGSVIHSLDAPFDHSDRADDSSREYLTEVSHIAGCCQIFRRELLDKVALDLDYKPFWYEDTDFCFQLQELGYKVLRFNSDGTFQHEWGGSGNTLFPGIWEDKFNYFKDKWYEKFADKIVV